MLRICLVFSVASLALWMFLGLGPARALELSDLKIDLENLGVDPDAEGWLRLRLQANEVRFQIRAAGLEPDSDYTLFATRDDDCPPDPDAIARATLHTDASGRLNASFETFSSNPDMRLDFDPRGQCLTLHDGKLDVLAVQLSTAAESQGATIFEQTQLAAWPAAENGRADVAYELASSGKRRFGVGVRSLPVGAYDVCVDGTYRETLVTNGAGVGRLDFMSTPPANGGSASAKKLPITFDPYGQEVEIWTESRTEPPAPCDPVEDESIALALSGPLLAQIPGINVCTASLEAQADLAGLLGIAGSGEARLEVADDCEHTFEVSVTGLVPGDYEVAVAGTVRGTFTVAVGGSGSIEFASDATGPSHLDFDPIGETIDVQLAVTDTVVVSGELTE